MKIAKVCSIRSIDPSIKHGCVAVSESGAILSTGYNGPPRNVNDSLIPLTRPEKYIFMEHAERNCIYNAARSGVSLDGCTFYVTGIPCVDCMRAMYQVGAVEVFILNIKCFSTNEDWYNLIAFLNPYINISYMEEEEL